MGERLMISFIYKYIFRVRFKFLLGCAVVFGIVFAILSITGCHQNARTKAEEMRRLREFHGDPSAEIRAFNERMFGAPPAPRRVAGGPIQ